MQNVGNVLTVPFYMTLLAQAYGLSGQYDAALKTIDEGLALFPLSESRSYEAEMHRVKGDLLLKQSPGAKAEAIASFRQALDIARRMQAKSLELRAAMGLFRAQGETARAELAGIYAWFTEGFDTPDLKEARALLGNAPKT
jgi:predicted ATPase